jgi:hypothetical protein
MVSSFPMTAWYHQPFDGQNNESEQPTCTLSSLRRAGRKPVSLSSSLLSSQSLLFTTVMLQATSLLLSILATSALAASVSVNAPAAPPGDNVTAVFPNFMGISLELSFINYYFGNDTASIPQPMLNYLAALHQRGGGHPVRLRLGGNSMDSSTYIPDQQQIINFTNPMANVNDQPVTYGQVLFNIMKEASDKVDSQWLIGVSHTVYLTKKYKG